MFDPDRPSFDPPDAEWTGVFAVAGHVVGGTTLTLSCRVSTNTEPFAGKMLENPSEAEVRATNIYRLEDGEWKIMHHHVDAEEEFIDLTQRLEAYE